LSELKKSGAKIVNAPRTVTVTGHRVRIQNVREFRHPSKYSEPTSAGKIIPVVFETVAVGLIMELEPKIESGNTIGLIISLMITELTGFTDHTGTASPQSAASPVWQPDVKRREISTEVTLAPGSTVLLSALGSQATDQIDFILVSPRILPSP
jgi:type II secretory pathway component GspD/PulD (secretin)